MAKAAVPASLTVRVSEKQYAWLRKQAEEREVWISDIVREIIAERLGA